MDFSQWNLRVTKNFESHKEKWTKYGFLQNCAEHLYFAESS